MRYTEQVSKRQPPAPRVVLLVLVALAVGVWLASRDAGPAPSVEASPGAAQLGPPAAPVAPAVPDSDGGAGSGSAELAEPPDLDDAPVRGDEREIARKANERGMRLIDRNIQNLSRQAVEAEQAGNRQQADLMRRRITHLRARRERLQAEQAEAAALPSQRVSMRRALTARAARVVWPRATSPVGALTRRSPRRSLERAGERACPRGCDGPRTDQRRHGSLGSSLAAAHRAGGDPRLAPG